MVAKDFCSSVAWALTLVDKFCVAVIMAATKKKLAWASAAPSERARLRRAQCPDQVSNCADWISWKLSSHSAQVLLGC